MSKKMGNKKASRAPVSKVSSAAAPAQSAATTLSANKSSVLRSAFSPSEYQLALFASVIQGLDAHHLRIHDLNSARLQCDHAVNPRETITSLDWGYYGDPHREREHLHQKKKRKRNSGVNGAVHDETDGVAPESVVVAFGTSSSDIRMYSPDENKVVGVLSGAHERGIRDFKFTVQKPGQEGWSVGGDGKLVQWDLRKGRSTRVVSLPSSSVTTLARPVPSNPPVLCASQIPYIIDPEKGGSEGAVAFDAMRNTIHSLITSSADLSDLPEEFLAADSDRSMTIFDTQKRKILGSLVADNEVESVSFYSGSQKASSKGTSRIGLFQKQVLAAVTRDGAIELFARPFHQFRESESGASNAKGSLKSQRKSMVRRADATIRLVRPDSSRSPVPVVSACFQGPELVIAWVEGGANLLFERIRWQKEDTEDLALQGETEIVKTKAVPISGSATANGVKDIGKTHVDETHAVVEQGGMGEGIAPGASHEEDAISISSDDEDQASQSENELVDRPLKTDQAQHPTEDVEMADAGNEAEPSFGELLRANAPETIDVDAALEGTDTGALVSSKHALAAPPGGSSNQLPSGLSLSTVLSQSLKTNDNSLLESCLHTTDLNIVRTTIQRLDSSLAITLLQRLAERLSTRPGRYGHLLVWVQWTCVAHGGAIAGHPAILRDMTALFKVMDQRSASLSSLLLLKGKLDMLDAQLGLRQSLMKREGARAGGAGSDDDEEGVIYVEGQEDKVESDEDMKSAAGLLPTSKSRRRGAAEDESEEEDEDMPLVVNGVASDGDEDEDEEDEDDDDDVIEDEAELSDDGGDGESEEEEDEDEDEEDDGSMVDFIADSNDDASEISLSHAVPKQGKTKNKKRAG